MPEPGQALHGRDERPGEQALRRPLAVPDDVVVDDLVVGSGAVAPARDLLLGELLVDDSSVGALRLAGGREHLRHIQRGVAAGAARGQSGCRISLLFIVHRSRGGVLPAIHPAETMENSCLSTSPLASSPQQPSQSLLSWHPP